LRTTCVEVEVGLVAEEAVPVELLGDRVPGPVRLLGVGEDDARAGELVGVVAPHVVVALGAPLGRGAGALEPGVLVARVVDHELRDHAQPAPVRLVEEPLEVLDRAVGGVDLLVRRDVVAVVFQRRRVEGEQPEAGDAERLDVVELVHQPAEVAVAVAVAVPERLDVRLVDHRVLVPERVVVAHRRHRRAGRRELALHEATAPGRTRNRCPASRCGSRRT
jgi:hypothetical protein